MVQVALESKLRGVGAQYRGRSVVAQQTPTELCCRLLPLLESMLRLDPEQRSAVHELLQVRTWVLLSA
jgi:hypothetical protein